MSGDCDTCEGLGKIRDKKVKRGMVWKTLWKNCPDCDTCPECGGKGKIDITDKIGRTYAKRTCSECRGEGTV